MGLIGLLREAGFQKMNFVGGEPTRCPDIGTLVQHAKQAGFVTGVGTNGSQLGELLDHHGEALDWVGLSVDSANEEVQAALGRGRGNHAQRSVVLAERCRDLGIRVKLNTVVTALNWREDMGTYVQRIKPERWKIFQVLRVVGQNDGLIEPLLVPNERFHAFLTRHARLKSEGYTIIAEDNAAMTDSYVMVDPLGRFFGNTGGVYRASPPILDVGVARAFAAIGFDAEKFEARGGRYAW